MSNSYQLRSHPDKPLFEHLKSVALATQEKIEAATLKISTNITLSDLERCAFIIGATHDIGKGTTYFQRYLPPIREIPLNPLLKSHSLISSLYCSWVILNDDKISGYRQFLAMASALAIQAHHGSLKRPTSYVKVIDNFYDEDVFAKQVDSFESIHELERISKDLGICSFTKFIKAWDTHFYDFRDLIVFPSYIIEKIFMDNREPYFLINLLYSCLLDADRLDVAGLPQFPERITKIKTDSVTSFVKNLTDDSSEIIRKLRNTLFDSIRH
jgi:CRISPR-associated endonuclease/helicase Cas3